MANNTTTFTLDFNTNTYSPVNAYWLAACSSLAYIPEADMKQTVCGAWNFDSCDFIDQKGTQCFIASNSTAVVIAFRGTDMTDVYDLLADINFTQTEAFGGLVHAGFYEAYNIAQDDIESTLIKHSASNKMIYLTGHSLGGALATLAAYDLYDKGYISSCIYTFGQPRVGDSHFVKNFTARFNNSCFRFVHKDDAVPNTVPESVNIGLAKWEYTDTTTPLYVVPENRLATAYESVIKGIAVLSKVMDAADAHSMSNYKKIMGLNININPFDSPFKYIEGDEAIDVHPVQETESEKSGVNKVLAIIVSKIKELGRMILVFIGK